MGVNQFTPKTRQFTQRNYVELLELITPDIYKSEDIALSGIGRDPITNLINANIALANNFSDVFSVSAVANTQTANFNSLSGVAQYFVKQNKLTNITPYSFETGILLPLGKSIKNFDTSSDFNSYLSGTLIPILIPAGADDSSVFESNMGTLSSLTGVSGAPIAHNYLIDQLGWFYFLNTSGQGGLDYSPSTYVLESFNRLYVGETLETVDGVKGAMEHLWRNNSVCSFDNYIPVDYVSGSADAILDVSDGVVATYTSGIQKLEALKTLVDVAYSPLYINQRDFRVRDAMQSFIDAELELDDTVSRGPLRKFQTFAGFGLADNSNEVEQLGLIYDIENASGEYLQYIADLIGFRLRGSSEDKWRNQLRIAIELYKSTGTLKAVQTAINALILDSVFDVSGSVEELWESYIPHLIWYTLGTESPMFRDLTTWTQEKADAAGVKFYSTSSLEENLKLATDSILLDLYRKFPDNFVFNGESWPVPKFLKLDDEGCEQGLYTIVNDPQMEPFHFHNTGLTVFENQAAKLNQLDAFQESITEGPLGLGSYEAGLEHPPAGEKSQYLKFQGDLQFVFNYRGKTNFPIPPFEEVKFYKNCIVTQPLVEYLIDRLKCFEVPATFAESVGDYITSATISNATNLGYLNDFLFFFKEAQIAPNFDDVMFSISNYEKNLLSLWNGKSSHLFVNFKDTDFDFSKTTLEGDGKYALVEAARVVNEFTPAHAIGKINLAASATDTYNFSGISAEIIALDKDDDFAGLGPGSVLGGFEQSGAPMNFATGGGDGNQGSNDGRGGLNTFKRSSVDEILDPLLSTSSLIGNVPRKSIRRRNYLFALPKEGYYDRTGFNGPISYDASVLEQSDTSSLGVLTLGYIPSSGRFHPVVDPINPSGVWDACETLNSPRNFSGIDTSTTFPYRGLASIETSATDKYTDRCQVPGIYIAMHKALEQKALDEAQRVYDNSPSSFDASGNFWNTLQSLANSAIAGGFVLNSFSDYENFKFGRGVHLMHRDYAKYFAQHSLNVGEFDNTGGNIFGHIFGRGLYNCDFSVLGSGVGNFVASGLMGETPINAFNVWNSTAAGTYQASTLEETEFRNPHILSGIEFVDLSGATSSNQFTIFELDNSFKSSGEERYLVGNRVIKCKAQGGFPRLRFDLSAYGERRNYFIKDHLFELTVNALVGEENSNLLGGGVAGVWIHTEPVSGVLWSWTPQGKWEPHAESDIDTKYVRTNLAHQYKFKEKLPANEDKQYCIENFDDPTQEINNHTLIGKKENQFEQFTVAFDTRNFSRNNNFEYGDIIPMSDKNYQIFNEVHLDNRNYIVEVFLYPDSDLEKYLLIDNIELTDLTQRKNAGIPTGYGVETSGTPLRQFVEEFTLDLDEFQVAEILKFFNGLAGQAASFYNTTVASRDAVISSGTMEVSGGSRLNYRRTPYTGTYTTASGFGNLETLEF